MQLELRGRSNHKHRERKIHERKETCTEMLLERSTPSARVPVPQEQVSFTQHQMCIN